MEEFHLQGLGKTFSPLLPSQPLGARPKESLPAFAEKRVLHEISQIDQTELKQTGF